MLCVQRMVIPGIGVSKTLAAALPTALVVVADPKQSYVITVGANYASVNRWPVSCGTSAIENHMLERTIRNHLTRGGKLI